MAQPAVQYSSYSQRLNNSVGFSFLDSQCTTELKLIDALQWLVETKIKYMKDVSLKLTEIENYRFLPSKSDNSPLLSICRSAFEGSGLMSDYTKVAIHDLEKEVLPILTALRMARKTSFKMLQEKVKCVTDETTKMTQDYRKNEKKIESLLKEESTNKTKYERVLSIGHEGKHLTSAKDNYLKTMKNLHQLQNKLNVDYVNLEDYQTKDSPLPEILDGFESIQCNLYEQFLSVLKKCAAVDSQYLKNQVALNNEFCETVSMFKPEDELMNHGASRNYEICSSHFGSSGINKLEKEPFVNYKEVINNIPVLVSNYGIEELKLNLGDVTRRHDISTQRLEDDEKALIAVEERLAECTNVDDYSLMQLLRLQLDKFRIKILLSDHRSEQGRAKEQLDMIKGAMELPEKEICLPDIAGDGFRRRSPRSRSSSPAKDKEHRIFKDSWRRSHNPASDSYNVQPRVKPFSDDNSAKNRFSQQSFKRSSLRREDNIVTLSHDRMQNEIWYYGDITRQDAETLLEKPEEFLVRYSKKYKKFIISVYSPASKNNCSHFKILYENGKYKLERDSYHSVKDLLNDMIQRKIPVTHSSGLRLTHPCGKRKEPWVIEDRYLTQGNSIGKGNFGEVYKGMLETTNKSVAIKTCSSVLQHDQFLGEAELLKILKHPNIVRLEGITMLKKYIVLEYAVKGELLKYLKQHRSMIPQRDMLSMCMDVSHGMCYLEASNIIHRDLAARNCLVYDVITVKISDFGLSREPDEGVYSMGPGRKAIPIKWTSPEGYGKGMVYTSKSDVWSFGILMWEVYSCGDQPYKGMTNRDCQIKIGEGYRMPAPESMPSAVVDLMQRCWNIDPALRPKFNNISEILERFKLKSVPGK